MNQKNQKNNNQDFAAFRFKYAIFFTLVILAISSPPEDLLSDGIPGYPADFKPRVFSGYLSTSSDLRKIHYIFIQNYKGQNNTDPVTLWMNGGPGCSSKIGFLQQIAPYLLPPNQDYDPNVDLVKNNYSWLNLTNLLFIDSPAGVGFSQNNDTDYIYNDRNTAFDNIDALAYFFKEKFPQYLGNKFYLIGESYAGKYIPDLAIQIKNYNAFNPNKIINIQGVLLGNPAINFMEGSLQDSQIQFMISHNFIDPKLFPSWRESCRSDPQSANCQFFYFRYEDLMRKVDPYNVYGPCVSGTSKNSQSLFIKHLAKKYSRISSQSQFWPFLTPQFAQCYDDKGIQNYFTIHFDSFKSQIKQFKVCSQTIFDTYKITPGGSVSQLLSLIQGGDMKVWLYSGDWDDVIPFTDTLKNLNKMGFKQNGLSTAWKIGDQHVGFIKQFNNNLRMFIVKGAGHQVPMFQKQTSYDLLQKFLLS